MNPQVPHKRGDILPLDALRATNLFGRVGPEIRARLAAVVDDPTEETWDDAYSIVLNGSTWTTLWAAVLDVDPTFPRTVPVVQATRVVRRWPRIPTTALILAALREAVPEA